MDGKSRIESVEGLLEQSVGKRVERRMDGSRRGLDGLHRGVNPQAVHVGEQLAVPTSTAVTLIWRVVVPFFLSLLTWEFLFSR